MSSNDSVQQGAVPDFDRMGPRVGERVPRRGAARPARPVS